MNKELVIKTMLWLTSIICLYNILTTFDGAIFKLQIQAINIWIISNQFQTKWSRRISEITKLAEDREEIKARDNLACPLLAYVNKISLYGSNIL